MGGCVHVQMCIVKCGCRDRRVKAIIYYQTLVNMYFHSGSVSL